MELKPCPFCGAQPEKETRQVMLGKIQDGGYPCIDGRLFALFVGLGLIGANAIQFMAVGIKI